MFARMHISSISISLAVLLAIAVVVPCVMVACDMSAGIMPFSPGSTLFKTCDALGGAMGQLAAVAANGLHALTLAFAITLIAVLALLAPGRSRQLAFATSEGPPTPPLDPRGVRLLI